jgi:hypothetical protein
VATITNLPDTIRLTYGVNAAYKIRAVGTDGVPSAYSDSITVINGQ